jgi:hypothetical protein
VVRYSKRPLLKGCLWLIVTHFRRVAVVIYIRRDDGDRVIVESVSTSEAMGMC